MTIHSSVLAKYRNRSDDSLGRSLVASTTKIFDVVFHKLVGASRRTYVKPLIETSLIDRIQPPGDLAMRVSLYEGNHTSSSLTRTATRGLENSQIYAT